ncbi:hypothetical protein LWI28_019111 [Acer negundo]|uniref:RNase H type-1 domain-containing protein n=1 Tax=Acer negundo TaxID=4023 RepID=A0AAD5J142_ACENE|nr:hypothetical protein LWI28_019111 [Acer negundo]
MGDVGMRSIANLIHWQPPPENLYKINTDVALDVERQIVGVGVVVRDHRGQVMGVSSQHLEVNFNPGVAQAIALFRGIAFAEEAGLVLAVIESDVYTLLI